MPPKGVVSNCRMPPETEALGFQIKVVYSDLVLEKSTHAQMATDHVESRTTSVPVATDTQYESHENTQANEHIP